MKAVAVAMSRQETHRERVLALIQAKYPGYHPLVAMVDLAHTSDDEKLRFDCHKTVAEYVEPKLRSIEVRGENMGGGLTVIVESSGGQPRNLIDDMAQKRQALLASLEKKEAELVKLPSPKEKVA